MGPAPRLSASRPMTWSRSIRLSHYWEVARIVVIDSDPRFPKCSTLHPMPFVVAHARLSLDRKGPVEVLATTLLTNKTAARERAQVFVVVNRTACSIVVTLKAREQLPIVCDGTVRTLQAGSYDVTVYALASRQDLSLPSSVEASDTQLVALTLAPASH